MKKLELFLQQHGSKIIIVLLVLMYFKSCGVDSELTKVKKELQASQQILKTLPTSKQLQIEGLKSEKRMIQATDRKLLDVQRQTQIEDEIKKIEETK
jgi:hypothetical protein